MHSCIQREALIERGAEIVMRSGPPEHAPAAAENQQGGERQHRMELY